VVNFSLSSNNPLKMDLATLLIRSQQYLGPQYLFILSESVELGHIIFSMFLDTNEVSVGEK
jgi:hypothetical protein